MAVIIHLSLLLDIECTLLHLTKKKCIPANTCSHTCISLTQNTFSASFLYLLEDVTHTHTHVVDLIFGHRQVGRQEKHKLY